MTISPRTAFRWLAGIALLILACLTSGCAVSPETRAANSPKAVQLAAGEGLVALKVAINLPRINYVFPKWRSLELWNAAQKRKYMLVDRSNSSASHALFIENLPAGTYEIRGIWNGVNTFYSNITLNAGAKETFPTFTIAPGQLTDLGTITFIRAQYPINASRYAWGHTYAPVDRAAALRQLSPALAAALSAQQVLGWDDEARLQPLRASFEAMRSYSMLANSPLLLANGRLVAGEAFGRIVSRAPDGRWTYLETPTALPIRSVYLSQDGPALAGSDEGVLFVQQPGKSEWETLALPVDDASVIDIGPLPGTEELLVVLQTRDRFIGLSTDRKAPGQWTEQFSRPRQLAKSPNLDAAGTVLRNGNHLVFASGSPIGGQETVTYDSTARRWTVVAVAGSDSVIPTHASPFYWALMNDGKIARFFGIPITGGRYFRVSPDGGASWERRGEAAGTFGPLLFVSDDVGYIVKAVVTISFEPPVDHNNRPTLWRTDDAGRSWTKVQELPAFPHRLLSLGGTERLGYASADGRFYSSTDGGKNWTLEKQVP